MNYQEARKIWIYLVFLSTLVTIGLYFLSTIEVTIEYLAIHMILILAGLNWLKKKRGLI